MTVEPIRDKEKIKQMYFCLNGRNPKYGLLFKMGLNTGLRISDILPIKKSDVYNAKGEFREYLIIKEKKTGKEKKIKINNALQKSLSGYILLDEVKSQSYLFYNMQTGSHLKRIQAYRILKEAANNCGIENFGTHSMRKTWGYWTYKASKFNIGLIMQTFNHSSQTITLRYIGINQDQKDELYSLVQF